MGVLHDVLIKVDRFIFPSNFLILDCSLDIKVPIIIRWPFITIGKTLVDMEYGEIKFPLNNK